MPLSIAIVETYFPELYLAPARLVQSEFETETAVDTGRGVAFFDRLIQVIQSVESDDDVVAIDRPPALGFLARTGLYAATSALVPKTPRMLDLASGATVQPPPQASRTGSRESPASITGSIRVTFQVSRSCV